MCCVATIAWWNAGEVAHAEYVVGRQRLEIELDLGEEPQRALGADEQMGHVVGAGRAAGEAVGQAAGDGRRSCCRARGR